MSTLSAAWTVTYLPHVHAPPGCWSIDSSRRCSSQGAHRSLRPLTRSKASGKERRRSLVHLAVAPEVLGFRRLRLQALVVGHVDRHDAVRAILPREHERRVELPQAVQPLRLEPPGRVEEPHVHDTARRVGEPGVDEAVGPRVVGCEVAQQVEGERLGRQQVRPQALVIDALLALDDRGSGRDRLERGRRHEARTGVTAVGQRDPAPDRPRIDAGTRRKWLGPDRVTLALAPAGLVQPGPLSERRHRGAPGNDVTRLPAERGLELCARRRLDHGRRIRAVRRRTAMGHTLGLTREEATRW